MARPITALALAAAAWVAAPLAAALPQGAAAPDFTTPASLAGKPFAFSLAAALRRGPVVLYFFPAAFTPGCTVEAHQFAEATPEFAALGATVIGMSADPIARLVAFSAKECRDRFAVATATPATIAAYDVALARGQGLADRTSYVILPDGRIAHVHSAPSPAGHVTGALAAVRRWRATHPRG